MQEKSTEKNESPKIATRNETSYSLHTMTLCAQLSPYEKNLIIEKLKKIGKKYNQGYHVENINAQNTQIWFRVARVFDFNEICLKCFHSGSLSSYWLSVVVNPRRMFHADDHPYVYIAAQEEILQSMELIQRLLDEADITEITRDTFKLSRVDYCVNIDLGDEDAVHDYLRLMKKGRILYAMQRKTEYSCIGRRFIPTSRSFTTNSAQTEFSIYDKYYQLNAEKEKYDPEEIEEARGLIRIEYRAKRPKICYEERKLDCAETLGFLELTPEIAERNICRFLKLTYGTGKFVRLKKAIELIDSSSYQQRTKNIMKKILQETVRRDLNNARLCFEDFYKYMKKFNQLGISPITLDKRSKYKEMENPLYYIEHCNKNQETRQ